MLKSIYKQFADVEVLHDITTSFEQTDTYAIQGVSGSGKSTLLHLLAGIDTPTSGNVFFNEQDINSFSSQQKQDFLNKKIGLIFQEPCLLQELTVLENVMLKGLIARQDYAACKQEGKDLLAYVGLVEKMNAYPAELSGGQQQRVSIVRALFNKPVFIIADEPTGNLDRDNADLVTALLISMHDNFGTGLIVSTHDNVVAQQMDTHYILEAGTLKQINVS